MNALSQTVRMRYELQVPARNFKINFRDPMEDFNLINKKSYGKQLYFRPILRCIYHSCKSATFLHYTEV